MLLSNRISNGIVNMTRGRASNRREIALDGLVAAKRANGRVEFAWGELSAIDERRGRGRGCERVHALEI